MVLDPNLQRLGFFVSTVCSRPLPLARQRHRACGRPQVFGVCTDLTHSARSEPAFVLPGETSSGGQRMGASSKEGGVGMAFVIAEPCTDVMDQACIRACPVACIHFHAGEDRKLYIDPAECIDCGACEPVCPVRAIYADYELPTKWRAYADIDALWYRDKEAARARVAAMKDGT
jgi:NAD-dependent dihydropyrimidine dehydrogenase PreA subunit